MKNTLPKILVALAILLLLPGCFWSDDESSDSATTEIENAEEVVPAEPVVKEVPKIFYISKSASECESIFFTCPEGRAFFTDKKGCGCREGAEAFSSDKKGLGDLIREHLASNLIESKCDGGVIAEFVYIDEGVMESGNLNYDVWAVAREFCPEGGEGASFDGAVAFEIEQSEFTRVVRDFTAADSSETSKIQKHFTEKAAEWILAKENFARDQVIAEIENNIGKRLSRFQSQLDREKEAREAELAAQAAAEKIKNETATEVENENVEGGEEFGAAGNDEETAEN